MRLGATARHEMATYKVLTKVALIKADAEAIRARREGQVSPSMLKKLPTSDVFPITDATILLDDYVRAQVVLDKTGHAIRIDIPTAAYESLPSIDA